MYHIYWYMLQMYPFEWYLRIKVSVGLLSRECWSRVCVCGNWSFSDCDQQSRMPKRAEPNAEKAYGRMALSDLTEESTKDWEVRAVAGETRQFVRPAADVSSSEAPVLAPLKIHAPSKDTPVGLRCGTCDVSAFDSLEDQYAHFKSDWHLVNLKRKAKGAPILPREEAEQYLKNQQEKKADEDDDNAYASSSSSAASDRSRDAEVSTTQEPVVEFSDSKSVFKVGFERVLGCRRVLNAC